MQRTSIEWTRTYHADGSFTAGYSSNPIRARHRETGKVGWSCTKTSPGCAACYAEAWNLRLGTGEPYTPNGNTGVEWELNEAEIEALRKPQGSKKVFLADMTDLWHEQVPDAWIDQIIAASGPSITLLLLTKRAARLRMYWQQARGRITRLLEHEYGLFPDGIIWPMRRIWLGVSVENQRMKWRIDELRQTPAAVRFLSCEPLLEDLGVLTLEGIDWVILGGESGPQRRPMRLEWLESIVEQCQTAGVKVFVKQGSHLRPGQQANIPDHLWRLKEFPT